MVTGAAAVLVLAWFHREQGRQRIGVAELGLLALVPGLHTDLIVQAGDLSLLAEPLNTAA